MEMLQMQCKVESRLPFFSQETVMDGIQLGKCLVCDAENVCGETQENQLTAITIPNDYEVFQHHPN